MSSGNLRVPGTILGSLGVKIVSLSRVPVLMPVILATQEAEIRRMAISSQPGQIVQETLSRKYPTKQGWRSGSSLRR
jgi:hypothetical protein